ncbi:MAG: CcmD family protein [Dehalococcoidia bacterium]|nr:CcmD family protein [Dehalococcoidia bacterium]
MTELTPNLPFLFAAFAVVWAVFFVYAAYMSWRRQSMQRELQDLREPLGSDQSSTADARDDGPV